LIHFGFPCVIVREVQLDCHQSSCDRFPRSHVPVGTYHSYTTLVTQVLALDFVRGPLRALRRGTTAR
jgi:hypothetical protein